jgi:hypothetical protein
LRCFRRRGAQRCPPSDDKPFFSLVKYGQPQVSFSLVGQDLLDRRLDLTIDFEVLFDQDSSFGYFFE